MFNNNDNSELTKRIYEWIQNWLNPKIEEPESFYEFPPSFF